VGAPPSAIGKFGGDTDNWHVAAPHRRFQHVPRVHRRGRRAGGIQCKENIPFKPKYHFPVSLDGVKKGDFTMIMGFPGSTDRFLSSDGVKLALDTEQPSRG
jgi:hypothetical protein